MGKSQIMQKNSDCLKGMRCPDCGQTTSFNIGIEIICTVTDDGAEDQHGDRYWDNKSFIACTDYDDLGCDWQGKVADTYEQFTGSFRIEIHTHGDSALLWRTGAVLYPCVTQARVAGKSHFERHTSIDQYRIIDSNRKVRFSSAPDVT
jgi:hypothetical protein